MTLEIQFPVRWAEWECFVGVLEYDMIKKNEYFVVIDKRALGTNHDDFFCQGAKTKLPLGT